MLGRTEIKMVGRILGFMLKEKKHNEEICGRNGVVCITEKMHEARMRWYGLVLLEEYGEDTKLNYDADL